MYQINSVIHKYSGLVGPYLADSPLGAITALQRVQALSGCSGIGRVLCQLFLRNFSCFAGKLIFSQVLVLFSSFIKAIKMF